MSSAGIFTQYAERKISWLQHVFHISEMPPMRF